MISRLSHPPERHGLNPGFQVFRVFIEIFLVKLRQRRTGSDGIYIDMIGRPFKGENPGQVGNRSFGDRIGATSRLEDLSDVG